MTPNAHKFLAHNPTRIGIVAGQSFYESPKYGDEAPLVCVTVGGRLRLSSWYDMPGEDEVRAWLTDPTDWADPTPPFDWLDAVEDCLIHSVDNEAPPFEPVPGELVVFKAAATAGKMDHREPHDGPYTYRRVLIGTEDGPRVEVLMREL